jgi:hypothetical protein
VELQHGNRMTRGCRRSSDEKREHLVSDESWKDQERAMRQGLERTSVEMLAYGDNGILAEAAIGRRLVVEATRSFNRSVARARAEGFTWEQIAEHVPGYVRAYGDEAGEALYDEVAVVSAGLQERYVSWRCGDCEALVLDQGPYAGHPADVEPGHRQGCVRHSREVAAYVAGLSAEEEVELDITTLGPNWIDGSMPAFRPIDRESPGIEL